MAISSADNLPATRSIPARNAAVMLARLEAVGLPRHALLEATGLDPQRLDSDGTIPAGQEIRLLHNAVDLGLPPGFGLSDAVGIDAYGLMGYAMMASATLRQAINIAMRYYRTAGPLFDLRFFVDADAAVIEADDSMGLERALPVVIEQLFSGLTPLLGLLLGKPVTPLRVCFAYPAPDNLAPYRAHFSCSLTFEAPSSQYQVSKALLDAPLARADASTARMFEQQCRELLEQLRGQETLASQISRQLLAAPGHLSDAESMAGRLNMGVRTMRRRLAAEDTSYREILDEVRRRMAMDYLESTELSIQEVAELLGFTEATNFRRAFLRWTGHSPARHRRHCLERGVRP